jgi:hypothetical protein
MKGNCEPAVIARWMQIAPFSSKRLMTTAVIHAPHFETEEGKVATAQKKRKKVRIEWEAEPTFRFPQNRYHRNDDPERAVDKDDFIFEHD